MLHLGAPTSVRTLGLPISGFLPQALVLEKDYFSPLFNGFKFPQNDNIWQAKSQGIHS